jgi:hypothetical protein
MKNIGEELKNVGPFSIKSSAGGNRVMSGKSGEGGGIGRDRSEGARSRSSPG